MAGSLLSEIVLVNRISGAVKRSCGIPVVPRRMLKQTLDYLYSVKHTQVHA
jgi:hypothetical protein